MSKHLLDIGILKLHILLHLDYTGHKRLIRVYHPSKEAETPGNINAGHISSHNYAFCNIENESMNNLVVMTIDVSKLQQL